MKNSSVTTLVFDMVGVLFAMDKMKALRMIKGRDLIMYYVKKRQNPLNEGMMLLDKMRMEVPGQYQELVAYKNIYLPNCFVLWNEGKISAQEALSQVHGYFTSLIDRNYFTDDTHKKVIFSFLDLLINSDFNIKVYCPITTSVKLLESLARSKRYKLYMLSNIDKETFEGMYQQHKNIFNLFDGIVTSCHSNFLKPNPTIFNYLFEKYQVVPDESLFIDDQIENIEAAKKLGMKTVHCIKPSALTSLIKAQGVVLK